jgi:3-keto-disaccharide hydrolase
MIMKSLLAALMVALMPVPEAMSQATKDAKPLLIFDGKTFTGWEGNLTIFRIEDGAIVGGSLKDKILRNEFLCTTRVYGDFELRLKFKLLGGDTANAGVQFRTKRIPNNHEVSGYQADMGAGWWGALYDESRRNKVLIGPNQEKMKDVVKAAEWNDYVIRAEGPHIQLWMNGVQTVDYVENDASIESRGVICPQIHAGPPSEAWYKDITIRDLTGGPRPLQR